MTEMLAKPEMVHPVRDSALPDLAGAKSDFNPRLESLRGVAALVVMVGHARITLQETGWQKTALSALSPFLNGHGAVILFFVMSGYVLGLSLRKQEGPFIPGFFRFGVRRILRIYPAFIFSMALTVAYLIFFGPLGETTTASQWFSQYYRSIPSLKEVCENLLLQNNSLNSASWTLWPEMTNSLMLVILCFISTRVKGVSQFILLAMMLGMAWYSESTTLCYLYLFYAGYLLPQMRSVFHWMSATPKREAVFALLCVAFLMASKYFPFVTRGKELVQGLSSLGLVGLIAYGSNGAVFGMLDWRCFKFLGAISYSFYLVHLLCILAVFQLMSHFMAAETILRNSIFSSAILVTASLILSLGLSAITYRWIEKPFMDFSKKLFRRAPGKSR